MSLASYAEAKAAYYANLDYDEVHSSTKAAAFRSAVRYLLLARPTSAERDGFVVSYESLKDAMTTVDAWLVANPLAVTPARTNVRYGDLSNLRGEF